MSSSSTDVRKDDGVSFVVGLPYATSGPPSYSYVLRLGAPDQDVDQTLAVDANNSIQPSDIKDESDPRRNTGIVLYSIDKYTLYSPTVQYISDVKNDWSADGLSVTRNGSLVSSAVWSSSALNCSFSSTVQMSVALSDIATLYTGTLTTVYAGTNATTGIGMMLWSNFGFTQNLFGGQVTNITATSIGYNPSSIEVQGWGSAQYKNSVSVAASTGITYSVSPGVAGVLTSQSTTLRYMQRINVLLDGFLVVAAGIESAGAEKLLSSHANDEIRDIMNDLSIANTALTGLITVVQAITAIAGLVLTRGSAAANEAATSQLQLLDGTARLLATSLGVPPDPSSLLLSTGLIDLRLAASLGVSALTFTLQDGVVLKGPKVTVQGTTELTLACGSSSIQITDTGIVIAAPSVTIGGEQVLVTPNGVSPAAAQAVIATAAAAAAAATLATANAARVAANTLVVDSS